MPVSEPNVNACAELIYVGRAGCDCAERGELRGQNRCGRDATLSVALEGGKEERPLFSNRPSDVGPELAALKERIRIKRISGQQRIGGEGVIAEEVKPRPVKLIAARTRDNVDGAGGGDTSSQLETCSGNLELLDHFLRKADGRTAVADLQNAAAVHRNAGPAAVLSPRRTE